MRRGELLALRWDHIDLRQRVAHLDMTKNGERRSVPLSSAAVEVLGSAAAHASTARCSRSRAFAVAAAFKHAVRARRPAMTFASTT